MIEIITFKLAVGADEAAFIPADARVQMEFFYQQPGLVRRTTARGADGEWAVITIWGSEADADAAATKATDDPAHAAFSSMVDQSTLETKRFEGLPG